MNNIQYAAFSLEIPLISKYRKDSVVAVTGSSGTNASNSNGSSASVSSSIAGIVKASAGVLSEAIAGTDYVAPSGSITGSAGSVASLSGHNISELVNNLTTADIPSSSNARYVSDSQLAAISSLSGSNTGDETASSIKTKLGISILSGGNTGDETGSSIMTKLGVSVLSGSNTGDETSTTIKSKLGITTLSGSNTGDETGTSILSKIGAASSLNSGYLSSSDYIKFNNNTYDPAQSMAIAIALG